MQVDVQHLEHERHCSIDLERVVEFYYIMLLHVVGHQGLQHVKLETNVTGLVHYNFKNVTAAK